MTAQVAAEARAGLTSLQAREALAAHGPNEIAPARRRRAADLMVEALREPMFILLAVAAGAYLVLGDLFEGVALSIGAVLAVALVIFQQFRSERALAALRELAQPHAHVIRDGEMDRIPAREVAPGDLLVVSEGERIPVDAELVEGVVSVDESVLTGEAAPVVHRPGDGALLAGTFAVNGRALATATRTGPNTEFGRIGASLATLSHTPTPLQQTARRVVRLLGAAALVFCALIILAYGLLRGDWLAGGLAGVTAAISLIPEEFPMVLSVFLALGAWRLARRNVLVRRPAAVEALGSVSVLCVDKTGTLTVNDMRLVRLWAGGAELRLADDDMPGPDWLPLMRAARLTTPDPAVDPMDRAVQRLAKRALGGRDSSLALRTLWPLTPARLAVVQLWDHPGDGPVMAAKGAPEAIFDLCRLAPGARADLHETVESLAGEGLRLLGVGLCRAPNSGDPENSAFDFVGLLGFFDPLREEAAAAVREAAEAGVRVVMITGDHPATALEIARQAGIDAAAGVLTSRRPPVVDHRRDQARPPDFRQPAARPRLRHGHPCADRGPGPRSRIVWSAAAPFSPARGPAGDDHRSHVQPGLRGGARGARRHAPASATEGRGAVQPVGARERAGQGGIMLAAVLGLYVLALAWTTVEAARGAALSALVTANLTAALAATVRSGGSLLDPRRRLFWSLSAAAFLVLAVAFATPALSAAFHIARPDAALLALAGAVGLVGGTGPAAFAKLFRG